MAKNTTSYFCRICSAEYAQWIGKCSSCGSWNCVEAKDKPPIKTRKKPQGVKVERLDEETCDDPRILIGDPELDRLFGGGLSPGSATLIGGDPGVGKSTLLLQLAARVAKNDRRVLFFSGEEAGAQIRARARRLRLDASGVGLVIDARLEQIAQTVTSEKPALIVVDSIQTLWSSEIDADAGGIVQLRHCCSRLISFCREKGIALILIGHVTKEGQIAGPRLIEHLVDAVMYIEHDMGGEHRLLRSIKNRYGPAFEIAVFEMRRTGMRAVGDPSQLFLSERDPGAVGVAVYAGMEGTRPLLLEIQALVVPATSGIPRRAVVGWDQNRLSMLIAVLTRFADARISGRDIFLNVAGGLRISDPGADLAVIAALYSAFIKKSLPAESVFFGEIGLSGKLRKAHQSVPRIEEALRMGLHRLVAPGLGSLRKPPAMEFAAPMNRIPDLILWISENSD